MALEHRVEQLLLPYCKLKPFMAKCSLVKQTSCKLRQQTFFLKFEIL